MRQLDAAEAMPAAARLRARSYQLLRLPPDGTVVDVGCGTARAVAELARHAAHAIGVDLDPAMLTVPKRDAIVFGGSNLSQHPGALKVCAYH